MTNEAVIVELFNGGRPMRYTVANGTAVPKGTIMELQDERKMRAPAGSAVPVAGIAATEKVADDGSTTLAVWTDGIFDLLVHPSAATIAVGGGVVIGTASPDNSIHPAQPTDVEEGKVLGFALGEGAGNETVTVRVNI